MPAEYFLTFWEQYDVIFILVCKVFSDFEADDTTTLVYNLQPCILLEFKASYDQSGETCKRTFCISTVAHSSASSVCLSFLLDRSPRARTVKY